MIMIAAVPKVIEMPAHEQLGAAREGNGRPRHLRMPYMRLRKTKNLVPVKNEGTAKLSSVLPWMGKAIDMYA